MENFGPLRILVHWGFGWIQSGECIPEFGRIWNLGIECAEFRCGWKSGASGMLGIPDLAW